MIVKPPSQATLKKYGLTEEKWRAILEAQGNVCSICKKFPKSGIWVTDHHHAAGWKKMPPWQRSRYIRGVICRFCNSHCVGRFMTLFKARNVVAYLEQYQELREETERQEATPRQRKVERKQVQL